MVATLYILHVVAPVPDSFSLVYCIMGSHIVPHVLHSVVVWCNTILTRAQHSFLDLHIHSRSQYDRWVMNDSPTYEPLVSCKTAPIR
ncbi:hypothetical protein TESG_08642 [Trichophyton tonsurans CBS 112818]|uniref:Uncharacterized protein n=1 Tax=Trichophyton tonsurans (strain CBS 112818) TaxID=647933 RepID=F2S9M4_TRIT1|nr:hypothetical protein TESG_08642 [Trichophyton tonsurans CBS 112818]